MSFLRDPLSSRWQQSIRISTEVGWYDLFSRGARDWLRHNEKVGESVEKSLPNLIAGPDVLSGPGGGTLLVPVRLAEHARFRLRDAETETGAGQGAGEPAIASHAGHVQVLGHHRLITPCQAGGRLVQRVRADVHDAGVNAGGAL